MTVSSPGYVTLDIERFWDGGLLPVGAAATIRFAVNADRVRIELDAPLFGDPAPATAPGRTERLWEHEVVELFVAGPGERYTELEFGPQGHHLVLMLEGVRSPSDVPVAIDYEVRTESSRWRATAVVPLWAFPARPWRVNAYQIHAQRCDGGAGRCHHAHAPVPGGQPDFHRLECFRAVG